MEIDFSNPWESEQYIYQVQMELSPLEVYF